INQMEAYYPLHAKVCTNCFLVQLEEYVSPSNIFSDYTYFSSYSDSWLQHAQDYAEFIIGHLGLTSEHLAIEVASNDGYLLQYFHKEGIPVLGIEPAKNVAEFAQKKGIRTEMRFFGKQTAKEMSTKYGMADLLMANNVLAHVPDINDFVGGMKILLEKRGVITLEFPHLLQLIDGNQFDTIYHEHFSYLSFITVEKIFAAHGLCVYDVEELPTHGGSLRIFVKHKEDSSREIAPKVKDLKERETSRGLMDPSFYLSFGERVKETKRKLLEFLISAKKKGKTIAAYGAPGKGNTLLNYCGIKTDFIDYTVDRSPHKQGNFLPGSRIPVLSPEYIQKTKPDYVLILPWNLKNEIMKQMDFIKDWGGEFVVPIPETTVYS
ncbi:class I SAM-dependent methyltransferase, partial [Xanthovirga aplysinae]|uniref:class I SAM-dependent methyltransferase n=1 Tax=Xanthovirga aplysinae TaxID=2529853 RepID=UPI001FE7281B